MKKISFVVTIASLLAAAPAFAQNNDSFIEQLNSTNATATVNQTGIVGHENDSNVVQDTVTDGVVDVLQINTGQANTSSVTQYDTSVETIVEQNSNGGDNTSVVSQKGTGIGAAQLSRVVVRQLGTNTTNDSKVDQTGTRARAIVRQAGRDNVSNSTISQNADFSRIVAIQRGAGNFNDSMITQTGTGNEVLVDQNGTGNDNDSTILQNADGSMITVNQGGSDNDNLSDIKQSANNSTIMVNQGLTGAGLNNESHIEQTNGSDNHIVINQN